MNRPLQSKLREFRKRKHWTLNKLSQLSGIPLITVWRTEHGHGVTLNNAFTIAGVFKVSVYDLWDIARPGPSAGMFVNNVISIRKLRVRRGWGLRELAKASGVSRTTLSVAEGGHRPSLGNAAKIAAALNVSVYDLWKPPQIRASGRR